jgi:outer membrane lipoprotein-sorting protein
MRIYVYVASVILLAVATATGWAEPATVNPARSAVTVTSPATAEPVTAPTPVQFIRRFSAAVERLGPCTITVDTKGSLPGTDSPAFAGTIVFQDWQHMVLRSTKGTWVGEAYLNGNQGWTYYPDRNTYTAGLPPKLRDVVRKANVSRARMANVLEYVLKDRWIAFLFSTLRVTAETIDGEPVYRLAAVRSSDQQPADSPIASVSLVVGRTDYLPRRVTVTGEPKYARDITLQVIRAEAPFPASTFVFTPPPGAVRVASPTQAGSKPGASVPK